MELKNYLEQHFDYEFHVNRFPVHAGNDSAYVVLIGGGLNNKNVSTPQVQILVRGSHPSTCETVSYQIYKHFNQKTDYEIGETRVVWSRGQQSQPIYTGQDEKERYVYSINLELLVDNY